MSLIDRIIEKFGKNSLLFGDLQRVSQLSPGPRVQAVFDQWLSFLGAYSQYHEKFRNKRTAQKQFLAAGTHQILESIKKGDWRGEGIPSFANAQRKLKGDQQLLKAKLRTIGLHYKLMDLRAKTILVELRNNNFLAELNNQGLKSGNITPYYSPKDQLHIIHMFTSLILGTKAGYDFLSETDIFDQNTGTVKQFPLKNLPLLHPERFSSQFKLTFNDLKAGGDSVLATFFEIKKFMVAGMFNNKKKSYVGPKTFQLYVMQVAFDNWEKLAPNTLNRVRQTPDQIRRQMQEFMKSETTIELAQQTNLVYGSMMGVLSLVAVAVTVKDAFDDADVDKVLAATKEFTGFIGNSLEVATIYQLRKTDDVKWFVRSGYAAKVIFFAAFVDVYLNTGGLMDAILKDPKNVTSATLKLAGSGAALIASILAIAGVTGPVGWVVAATALILSFAGILSFKPDTYIEQFIDFGEYGDSNVANKPADERGTNNPALVKYKYQFMDYQLSSYYRLIFGMQLIVKAITDQRSSTTTYTIEVEIKTNYYLPLNTIISLSFLRSNGVVVPLGQYTVTGATGSQTSGNVVVEEHWALPQDNRANIGELVLQKWTYRNSFSNNEHFDGHFEAVIKYTDDTGPNLQKQIFIKEVAATQQEQDITIPLYQIPYNYPLSLYLVNSIKHVVLDPDIPIDAPS